MNEKPFFSVIIPALNEAKYLPKLLGDLSKQSFKDFEVIVVDGKSDDKTVELAKAYSPKLPKLTILTSDRRHVCIQRNLGAKQANGEVLVFSDADNRLPPHFLLGIRYKLELNNADVVTPWFKPDKDNTANNTIALAMNLAFEFQKSISSPMMLESLIVIKKEFFEKIGGFDENIHFAEGRQFATSIVENQLDWIITRDPTYQFSFRRFRKFGTLNIMRNTAALGLSNLLGSDYKNKIAKYLYPMKGGSLFEKSKKEKGEFLKNVSKLLKKLDSF